MASIGSVTREPHSHAFYWRCAPSGNAQPCAPKRTRVVGGSDCPVVFTASAHDEWSGYSEFACRLDTAVLPHLLPATVLHPNGSCLSEKRFDGHSPAVTDGLLLWRNRIYSDLKSV